MTFTFSRARRQKLKLRIALTGPSGSGKTYSALRLAAGLTGGGPGKVALIDTENRRGDYYADEFTYDTLNLEPPYAPERYVEAIRAAEAAGYEAVIIDSASHEWMGPGGILDTKDKMPGANDYTKWATLTPRHEAFIQALTGSRAHIIACLRGKDQYVLETNEKGKQIPRKVGMGAQQREGLEYECTVAFLLDQSHIANATKDNTRLFDGRWEMLTEEDGRRLAAWADQGADPQPAAGAAEAPAAGEAWRGALPEAEYRQYKRLMAGVYREAGMKRAEYQGLIAGALQEGRLRTADTGQWTAAEWEAIITAIGGAHGRADTPAKA